MQLNSVTLSHLLASPEPLASRRKEPDAMDVDFWASRVHPTKHCSVVHSSRFNYSDDSEDDDMRACFPCPFCYVEIELSLFCSHLQEEHCFDLKNAVCPMCAGNLGKDVIGHFVVQHANSLKRRKKPQASGLWTAGSRERSLATSGRRNDSAPDPLLSPFLFHIPPSPESFQQDECPSFGVITSDLKRNDSSLLDEGLEQDIEEKKQRVAFVQQLMASMIF